VYQTSPAAVTYLHFCPLGSKSVRKAKRNR